MIILCFIQYGGHLPSIHSFQQHFQIVQYASELTAALNEDLEHFWFGLFDIVDEGWLFFDTFILLSY